MIQTEEAPGPLSSVGDEATRPLEGIPNGEFKLETTENVAFAILMIMPFYAALESTGIGVALPVNLFSFNCFLIPFDNC